MPSSSASSGGFVVWLTGLPASGKSTVAKALEGELRGSGRQVFVMDGDEIRRGLNSDLGFGPDDRLENIRRVAEVSRLFAGAGIVCICALISPLRSYRDMARRIVDGERFVEVFVDTDPAVCEARDPKGHYKKARAGLLPEFTGVTAPYEPPARPDVHLRGGETGERVAAILAVLRARGLVSPGARAT